MWSAYTPTAFVRFSSDFFTNSGVIQLRLGDFNGLLIWKILRIRRIQSHRPCQSHKRRKMKFDFTFSASVSHYWGQGCDHPVCRSHIISNYRPIDSDWVCVITGLGDGSQMVPGSHPSGNWRDEIRWAGTDERGPTVRQLHTLRALLVCCCYHLLQCID